MEEGFRIDYRTQIESCQSKPSKPTKTKTYQMLEKKNYKIKTRSPQLTREVRLTILSAARWWPTQGLQTSSGHRGQGEPGVDST